MEVNLTRLHKLINRAQTEAKTYFMNLQTSVSYKVTPNTTENAFASVSTSLNRERVRITHAIEMFNKHIDYTNKLKCILNSENINVGIDIHLINSSNIARKLSGLKDLLNMLKRSVEYNIETDMELADIKSTFTDQQKTYAYIRSVADSTMLDELVNKIAELEKTKIKIDDTIADLNQRTIVDIPEFNI